MRQTFIYNKLTNVVNAEGEVKVEDQINENIIFSDKATYLKNEEIVFTEGNSRAIDNKKREITAKKITYNKILNTFEAEGEVKVEDQINENIIFSDKATYLKNEEIVFTEGNSRAIDNKKRNNCKKNNL